VTLPTGKILLGILAVGAGVVAVGWPIAQILHPVSADAVWLGGPPAAGVVALGVLALQPWKPRAVVRWPMALFGVQGATTMAVGLVGWVVFREFRPAALAFAGSLMAGFVGSWVVVAKGLSRAVGARG
jgi:hypothetical protein